MKMPVGSKVLTPGILTRHWKNNLKACVALSPMPALLCLVVSLEVRVG